MVIGVGVLMHIVTISGGIDLLIEAMKGIMTTRTAATITGALAGIMSLFSSGLGVVFPTLIPTAGGLAQSMGANAVEICAVSFIGLAVLWILAYAGLYGIMPRLITYKSASRSSAFILSEALPYCH